MTRIWTALLLGLVVIGNAANVAAQELKPAVFGAVGVANVYRAEDRSFGTEVTLGGGLGLEWKRLGLDVEAHRVSGLTPRAVQCGLVNMPCVGSAREGFEEATMLSGNVSYFFGRSRVHPYLTGSVGLLWTEGVHSLTIVSSTGATLSEFRQRDTGLALGVGFGVDVPLTRALSLPGIQDVLVSGDVASESWPASRKHRHAISLVMTSPVIDRSGWIYTAITA